MSRWGLWSVLGGCWVILVIMQPDWSALLATYGGFTALGIIGAIFANATGAGGGVVFVPFFHQLGMPEPQIVATSFAIQCCGMTAGALTWWHHYQQQNTLTDSQVKNQHWLPLVRILTVTVPCSVAGLWFAQWGERLPGLDVVFARTTSLHTGFSVFSILLALGIFFSVTQLRQTDIQHRLSKKDAWALGLIGVAGGIITARLSVGVGELLAVYLIMRRFSVTLSIAAAVIVTALSVWGGLIFHVLITQAISWPIVLFAGAGAIVGGRVAKYVVLAFKPTYLKVFFGLWILLMGIAGLAIA